MTGSIRNEVLSDANDQIEDPYDALGMENGMFVQFWSRYMLLANH